MERSWCVVLFVTRLTCQLTTRRTKGCAMLWRLFIELELRSGDFQSAKRLLYRAVRECPFAKGEARRRHIPTPPLIFWLSDLELYMMAFDALRLRNVIQLVGILRAYPPLCAVAQSPLTRGRTLQSSTQHSSSCPPCKYTRRVQQW